MNTLLIVAVFAAWPALPQPTDWPQLPPVKQVAVAWPQLPALVAVKVEPKPQLMPKVVEPVYQLQTGTCVGGACYSPQSTRSTTTWRRRFRR